MLKSGRLARSTRLYLYRLPNEFGRPRLALIVPKRFAARAVARNRIRRLAREAFRLAQKRLGPGRIHHVMRWLGQMQRAFDLMCSYALEREAFVAS